MKLVLATKNPDKIREIKQLLADLPVEILTYKNVDYFPETIEDGNTLIENAQKKALEVRKATGLPSLADDTGLFVDYLNGKPGVYSSRFAGENVTYKENRQKLLSLMKDAKNSERSAYFKTVAVYVDDKGKIHTATGICKGMIIEKERGINGFGYDPIFIPKGIDKTFAEMDNEQKNRISHRGVAFRKIKQRIVAYAQARNSDKSECYKEWGRGF